VSTILQPITVDEYERMIDDGTIPEDSRVELIEGKLVEKVTKHPPHALATGACHAEIQGLLPAGWHARKEDPVRIPSRASEPEPDVSVARGTFKTYARRHPNEVDIALIVEVADTSLAKDRALVVTYGAAGIPIYWIVNLVHDQVEVYADPDPGPHGSGVGGYRSRVDYQPGQDVPVIIDGREVGRIAVTDLLP
jgi:Uma2 family endonuclease